MKLELVFASGLTAEDRKTLNELQGWDIIEGRNLKKGDGFKVVVGYNHFYRDVWEKQLRIGSKIKIEGHDFKIVGVMGKIGNPI